MSISSPSVGRAGALPACRIKGEDEKALIQEGGCRLPRADPQSRRPALFGGVALNHLRAPMQSRRWIFALFSTLQCSTNNTLGTTRFPALSLIVCETLRKTI